MGRKSTLENKNIYFTSRENAQLTREAAAEVLGFISEDRIDKIEHGKPAYPDEVLRMAECYRNPSLCNYYCSQECPIGQKYVPAVESKPLSQITLEMLNTLNTLNHEKERLIEITVDGKISKDEIPDFLEIRSSLDNMSLIIDTLRLWVDNAIADGSLDRDLIPD